MIFSFFKKPKDKSKTVVQRPFIFRPMAMWHIIVCIGFLLIVGFGIFSGYLYSQIKYDEAFQFVPEKKASTDPIKHSKLEEVLNAYEKKGQMFSDLEVSQPKIIDPSL